MTATDQPQSELLSVLWDDGNGTVSAQRYLVSLGLDEYLLLDGRPTDLTKVMGPLSFEEGVTLAERLLRDGILTESDMARALAVCTVLVACTRTPEDGKAPRLIAVPHALRERKNAAKAAEPGEAA